MEFKENELLREETKSALEINKTIKEAALNRKIDEDIIRSDARTGKIEKILKRYENTDEAFRDLQSLFKRLGEEYREQDEKNSKLKNDVSKLERIGRELKGIETAITVLDEEIKKTKSDEVPMREAA